MSMTVFLIHVIMVVMPMVLGPTFKDVICAKANNDEADNAFQSHTYVCCYCASCHGEEQPHDYSGDQMRHSPAEVIAIVCLVDILFAFADKTYGSQ